MTGGTLRGDATARVTAVAPLNRAASNPVGFLGSGRSASLFARADAGVLLVSPALADTIGNARAGVVVPNPREAMLSLLPALYPPPPRAAGIHPTAVIGQGVAL